MRVLLLVAGRSKRFWPLTEKSLWPVCGKSLLDHQLERLKSAGLTDITLIGGEHNKEEIAALYPKLPFIVQEDPELGMQGAMMSALPSFGNDPVLIVGGNDIVESSAFAAMKKAADKKENDGALLAKKVTTYFPGGYLTLDGVKITSIVEKPGAGKEPSDLVNIVVHYHKSAADFLKALESVKAKNDDGYEQALTSLFATKHYEAVSYNSAWNAVKYPWHLMPLTLSLLNESTESSIASPELIHPTAVIEGNVRLAKGVKVMAHATIVGPCVIGEGTVIANNALVRQSSIGERCVIGYSTEVVRSVLRDDVWTHSSYIGDSVIGSNVSFGASTVTANLRLDEGEIGSTVKEEMIATGLTKFGTIIGDDCRIGVHVTLSPGSKIGSGSMVASDVSVAGDIPERSYVVMKKGEMQVRTNEKEVPKPTGREAFRKSARL